MQILEQISDDLAHLFHPRRSNNHRPHVLHPQSFLLLAVAAVAFSLLLRFSSPLITNHLGDVLGFASSITADQVVSQTNQQRANSGLPPLKVNAELNQAAQAKAAYMFAHQFWAHTAPDGTEPWKFFRDAGYHYQVAGENLARDFSNTNDMVAAWMASPTHRANMVNAQYKEIGVAVVDGKLLGTDTTLVVQLFGDPQIRVPQISDAAQPDVKAAETQVGPSPSMMTIEQNQPIIVQDPNSPNRKAEILSSTVLPITSFKVPPLFSPLQLMKAFFLAIILMIVLTLIYDAFIMRYRNTIRFVGKNFAHILLLAVVAFLVIFFKSGIVQ